MEPLTAFRGACYKITTDREGESRIVFEAPLSEMPKVTKLLLALQEELLITVERVPHGAGPGTRERRRAKPAAKRPEDLPY